MDTPKTLAARLRDRSAAFKKLMGNYLYYGASDAEFDEKIADYLERLSAPDVGVGLTLETTAEEREDVIRYQQTRDPESFGYRAALDVDTLTAALAASTAREKAKDEEIAGLEAALKAYDTLSLVISSAVREAQPSYRDQLSVAIKSARAALSGRKPDKEGT